MRIVATYVLPLRCDDGRVDEDLADYVTDLATWVDEVIVVDGSPEVIFEEHATRWADVVLHLPPDPDLRFLNGKVNGVLTGVRRARHERVVIADDDVRYDPATLRAVVDDLASADVVRPQNHFDPLPWHARWDSARTLIARATGSDFPGTLGVRRSALDSTGGYDGDVLFENLELLRTIAAAGGVVRDRPDRFVRRCPPTTGKFWSQRVRQAYDELARPERLVASLAVLPTFATLARRRRWPLLVGLAGGTVGIAEIGRRRAGGRAVFPLSCSLLAPVWVLERGVCSWLAVAARAVGGGVPYAGARIRRAATPARQLRRAA